MKIGRVLFYIIFIFMLCGFRTSAMEVSQLDMSLRDHSVDYLFTTSEVNLSKITDTSITISSENFDKEFLDNAVGFKSFYEYDVVYDDGVFVVSGLIPDFFYDSLYIEAASYDGEKYILQIRDFKTAKSQDAIKQFITTTMQYTLKRKITPIDFYMWEHKILVKEVTPSEFVLRILQDPQILYNIDSKEKFIERMYSGIFLSSVSVDELSNWVNKFEKYKKEYFLKDSEVYQMIAEEMLQSDDFKNRVSSLEIENVKIPLSTRYDDVYKKSKFDNKDYEGVELDEYLYVMDYDEINRTEVGEDYAILFLNGGFKDKLSSSSEIFSDMEDMVVKYENGKIIIEGLIPNTVYKNFTLTYMQEGKEKSIFVQRIKTSRTPEQKNLRSNVLDGGYNFLNHFGISVEDFLKIVYGKNHDEDLSKDAIINAKLLFVAGEENAEKIFNFVYESEIEQNVSNLILNLYNMIFGRFPDSDGFEFWMNRFEYYKSETQNLEYSIRKVVEEVTLSPEFEDKFNRSIMRSIIKLNNKNKKPEFKPISFDYIGTKV